MTAKSFAELKAGSTDELRSSVKRGFRAQLSWDEIHKI